MTLAGTLGGIHLFDQFIDTLARNLSLLVVQLSSCEDRLTTHGHKDAFMTIAQHPIGAPTRLLL